MKSLKEVLFVCSSCISINPIDQNTNAKANTENAAIIGKNINISDMTFYIATIMAVIGHNFPFYLKFKGGKGVAVASGITLSTKNKFSPDAEISIGELSI